jgi:hypothetical protein
LPFVGRGLCLGQFLQRLSEGGDGREGRREKEEGRREKGEGRREKGEKGFVGRPG